MEGFVFCRFDKGWANSSCAPSELAAVVDLAFFEDCGLSSLGWGVMGRLKDTSGRVVVDPPEELCDIEVTLASWVLLSERVEMRSVS